MKINLQIDVCCIKQLNKDSTEVYTMNTINEKFKDLRNHNIISNNITYPKLVTK